MGFNYFGMIEDIYSTKISTKKPCAIRLDGKNVTKNLNIHMFNENQGGFAYALIETAKELSKRYHALVFVSTDEIDLIFYDSKFLKDKFNSTKTQKISSLISQETFYLFNNKYNYGDIYFDARTFSMPEDKTTSYIKFRIKSTYAVSNTYVAKRNLPVKQRHRVPLKKVCKLLDNKCPNINRHYEYFESGFLFFNGQKVDKDKLLEHNILNLSIITDCLEKEKIDPINNSSISCMDTFDIFDILDEDL